MSEQDTGPGQAGGTVEQRLDGLETTQREQGGTLQRIEEALAKMVPGSHAEAQQRQEDKLDRPSTVEEQVRAELARAKQEEDAAAADSKAKADAKAERETLEQRLKALEEKPPDPPARRATKLLGWGS